MRWHSVSVLGWSLVLFFAVGSALYGQEGREWKIVLKKELTRFTDIDSYDSLNSLVVGKDYTDGAVWSSIDGGRTWEEVFLDTTFRIGSRQYTSVKYWSSGTAILSKSNISGDSICYVMKSMDRGRSWREKPIHSRGGFSPFSMYDTLHGGGISSPSTLWVTSDGWETWDSIVLVTPPGWVGGWVEQLGCVGPGRFLCCWTGSVAFPDVFSLSLDTGKTWEYYPLSADSDVFIESLSFLDSLHGWAVADQRLRGIQSKGYIYRTRDGGRTWETQFEGIIADSAAPSDVEFADSLNGLVVTNEVVLRTTDGGRTWKEEEYESEAKIAIQLARMAVDYTPGNPGLIISAFSPVLLRYGETVGVGEWEVSEGKDFQIVPNPAHDRLRVVYHSSEFGKEVRVRLFDLLGRDVLGRSVPVGSFGSVELDIAELPAGVYRAVIEGAQQHIVAVRSVMVVR